MRQCVVRVAEGPCEVSPLVCLCCTADALVFLGVGEGVPRLSRGGPYPCVCCPSVFWTSVFSRCTVQLCLELFGAVTDVGCVRAPMCMSVCVCVFKFDELQAVAGRVRGFRPPLLLLYVSLVHVCVRVWCRVCRRIRCFTISCVRPGA